MNTRLKLNRMLLVVVAGFALCLVPGTNAQVSSGGSYSVTQKAVAGGGASSAGGSFELKGTIGQHDAATLTGGLFTVEGGFWPGNEFVAPPVNCAQDYTSQMEFTLGDITWNPVRQRYEQQVSIKYHGTVPIGNVPVSLVLDNLTPGISLEFMGGKTSCAAPAGSPYLSIGGMWQPEGTQFLALSFVVPSTPQTITYTPRLLVGDVF